MLNAIYKAPPLQQKAFLIAFSLFFRYFKQTRSNLFIVIFFFLRMIYSALVRTVGEAVLLAVVDFSSTYSYS